MMISFGSFVLIVVDEPLFAIIILQMMMIMKDKS